MAFYLGIQSCGFGILWMLFFLFVSSYNKKFICIIIVLDKFHLGFQNIYFYILNIYG